jgi:hypothetical protein
MAAALCSAVHDYAYGVIGVTSIVPGGVWRRKLAAPSRPPSD